MADHALAGRDRRRHLMAQRMPGFPFANGGVAAEAGPAVAVLTIGACRLHVAVVGVNNMASGTTRVAIVAWIVVGAEKPSRRVVEARLGDVQNRYRDAQPGPGAAVRLAEIGTPRLFEALQLALRIGVADLGELGNDVASAALEDAEDVAGREHLPGR